MTNMVIVTNSIPKGSEIKKNPNQASERFVCV